MTSDQFQRSQLLFGVRGLMHLRAARVAVVGCGAVGSFAAEALARVGVGHITLVDGDTVEPSNINRQLCALHSTVGQNKTAILASRIQDICSGTEVISRPVFLNEENAADILSPKPDFVIDAIDQIPAKTAPFSLSFPRPAPDGNGTQRGFPARKSSPPQSHCIPA